MTVAQTEPAPIPLSLRLKSRGATFQTSAITITGIQTNFSSTDGRTVVVELWQGAPPSGTLLTSANYIPQANTFHGVTFAGVALTSGTNYFVAFRNVGGLGLNTTVRWRLNRCDSAVQFRDPALRLFD